MSRPGVIQVQFKPDEAVRIAANAASAGLTESQYVRHLTLARLTSRAWWARSTTGATVGDMRHDGVTHMRNRPSLPDYHLEVLTELGGGSATYRVFAENLQPMKRQWLEQHANFRELDTGRLVLGDHTLWHIVRTMSDSDTGQVIWSLEPDRRPDTALVDCSVHRQANS